MTLDFDIVKKAVTDLGYQFFESGDYNLNLVGIRTQDRSADTFNDWLCILFYVDGAPVMLTFAITTDPGSHYRRSPSSAKGVAIVKPGQYPGLWCTGFHRGQYQALVQKAPITVYRDNDKDNQLDLDAPLDSGNLGINCHRSIARGVSRQVGRWSAGCQVFASATDFDLLMALCQKSASIWGDSFTYTLIEEKDIELI